MSSKYSASNFAPGKARISAGSMAIPLYPASIKRGSQENPLGSCTWGWGRFPCDLPSRMLGIYKTGEDSVFPVKAEKNFLTDRGGAGSDRHQQNRDCEGAAS